MALTDIYNFLAVDENLATAGQPTERQVREVREAGFEAVVNLGLLDPRYCLPDEASLVRELGMDYHHIPVDFGAPQRDDYAAFRCAMRALRNRRTFVHCAANIRVSAFVSLYGRHELGWSEADARAWATRLWLPNFIWQSFLDRMAAEPG